MAKKNPIKYDGSSLNFRVSNELKAIIVDKAQNKKITTSEYVRDLLESVHNGDYCYKEQMKEKINSFLFSREFMQLLVWIYSKNENREKTEKDAELDRYIKTLKQVDGHMPDGIVNEFDKVLYDIIRVKTESVELYSFNSYYSVDKKKFNSEKVKEFLLNDLSINMYISVKGMKNIETPNLKGMKFPLKL